MVQAQQQLRSGMGEVSVQLLARPKCYLLSKLNIDVCGVSNAHLFLCPILKQGVAMEVPANRSLSPLAAIQGLSPGRYAPCRFWAWLAGAAGASTCQLTDSAVYSNSLLFLPIADYISPLYIATCHCHLPTAYKCISSFLHSLPLPPATDSRPKCHQLLYNPSGEGV